MKLNGLVLILLSFFNPMQAKQNLTSLRNAQDLQVSIYGRRPYFYFCQGPAKICGVDIDILKTLSQHLNFTYKVKLEQCWGYSPSRTNCTGTVGAVKSGDSVMGMGHMEIMWDSYQAIDFTTPTYALNGVLMTAKPREGSPYLGIIRPFDAILWLLLILTWIFLAMAFKVYFIFSYQNPPKKYSSLLLIWRIFLFQNPKWTATEKKTFTLLFGLGLFLSTMGHMAYDSNLKAHLTMPTFEKEPNTLQEVLDLHRPFFVTNGTSLEQYVFGLPNEEFHKMQKAALEANRLIYTNQRNLLEKELLENFLNLRGASVVLEIVANSFYDLFVQYFGDMPFRLSPPLIVFHGGIVIEKNSAIAHEIDTILLRLVKGGIINKWTENHLDSIKTAKVTIADKDANQPIGMAPMIMPLILWLIGLVMSTGCLLIEVFGSANSRESHEENHSQLEPAAST